MNPVRSDSSAKAAAFAVYEAVLELHSLPGSLSKSRNGRNRGWRFVNLSALLSYGSQSSSGNTRVQMFPFFRHDHYDSLSIQSKNQKQRTGIQEFRPVWFISWQARRSVPEVRRAWFSMAWSLSRSTPIEDSGRATHRVIGESCQLKITREDYTHLTGNTLGYTQSPWRLCHTLERN